MNHKSITFAITSDVSTDEVVQAMRRYLRMRLPPPKLGQVYYRTPPQTAPNGGICSCGKSIHICHAHPGTTLEAP